MTKLDVTKSLEEYREAGGKTDSAENQRICDKLVEREVIQCVSSLVHHFATNDGALDGSDYDYDDVLDLCRNNDWETAAENAIDEWDRDQCVEYLESLSVQCYDDDDVKVLRKACKVNANDEGLEDFCQDRSIDPEEREVYEHWVVSSYFAEKLKALGETTGELFNLTIWGRCTTGQSIAMDYVIQQIAAEMEILVGQKCDWSKS